MEFLSIVGSQHTIEPIGYHQVRKKRRTDVRCVVRSIKEQFMIHSIASDFRSHCLHIPNPLRIESSQSYIMDMIYHFVPLAPEHYKEFPHLFEELINFKNYMYVRGYFAAGFTILRHPESPIFVLVDFSQFGTIDSHFVMFPKIPLKYTVLEAEANFGLIGCDVLTQSFKKKHIIAKSPRITPSISPCMLNFELDKMETVDDTNMIVVSRSDSDTIVDGKS
jgi:hypothetical protein